MFGKNLIAGLALTGAVFTPFAGFAQGAPQGEVPIPKGWFGVMISDQALLNESGTAFFDRYPVVSKVEDDSPAAKAGVRPGDVLMTFNSHDMRGSAFEMSNWLKPGAPFVLRLRRNDRIHVVRGIVQRRPENWTQRVTVELSPTEEMLLPQRSRLQPSPGSGTRTVYLSVPRSTAPARLPYMVVPALGLGGGLYPFAGAEFTSLNDDLSEVLGVRREGVFVTNVIEGSLARNSGLRGGDVVVMADSIRLQNPTDLVRAIRNASDASVKLQIIRRHRQQTITLDWALAPRD